MTFDNSAAKFTITEKEFATFVGISPQLVAQLRKAGKIPFVRVGARVLYLQDDARRFVEQHRHASAECAA
jgi:hypothetical protein